jgi:hypothetical protein
MAMTASKLRQDIYRVLDHILATGEPVIIERQGRTLRITADDPGDKWQRLIHRPDAIIGDPDDLVHLDWSGEWKP